MAKEKSTTELRDEKQQLTSRSQEIIASAKTEKRMFNDKENEELASIQNRKAEINLEIEKLEDENRSKSTKHQPQKEEKFSLRRAIVAQMNHTAQRDSEASVIEEAAKLQRSVSPESCGELVIPLSTEKRATFTATTEAATGVVVDTDKQEMLLPLEPNLVLSQAGVRMMTGLVGNIMWPKTSAANVFWEGENDEAQDGANTISKGTVFSPHRLTAYVDISKQLLIQENISVEGLVRQLIAVAIAQKIEATAFSNAVTAANVPDGIFQTLGDISGAMTWANVVKMETAADTNNALLGNLAYIMHPALIGSAKTKVKDASGAGGFIFGNDGQGMLNGYKALRSTNVPSGLQTAKDEYGIVFGDWSKYFLGQWGAIDLTVDQYTQATKGAIRLVVNSYWNMGFIRKESFSIASMK